MIFGLSVQFNMIDLRILKALLTFCSFISEVPFYWGNSVVTSLRSI